jgi:hypothetical protein
VKNKILYYLLTLAIVLLLGWIVSIAMPKSRAWKGPAKPYVLYVSEVTVEDEDICKSDENCMDIMPAYMMPTEDGGCN